LKKFILMIPMVFALLVTGAAPEAHAELAPMQRAEASLDALIELYWNGSIGMFDNAYPCRTCDNRFTIGGRPMRSMFCWTPMN